jgi:hypothetical protein
MTDVMALSLLLKEEGASVLEGSLRKLGVEVAKTAAGFASIGFAVNKFVTETTTAQFAVAQLESMLRSTEAVSGQTSMALQEQASALQNMTTYSDDAVLQMQSLLLMFDNIQGAIYTRAVPAIADLATTLGMDLSSAAMMVGKALQDPENGLMMLNRQTKLFSEEQKKLIEELAKAGEKVKAQELILAKLETRFNGAAKAARNTLGGALKALDNAFGDLFEASRESTSGIVNVLNKLTDMLVKVNDNMSTVKATAIVLGGVLAAMFSAQLVAMVGALLAPIGTLATALLASAAAAGIANTAVAAFSLSIGALKTALTTLLAGTGFGAVLIGIAGLFAYLNKQLDDTNKIYDDLEKQEQARFEKAMADAAAKRKAKQDEQDAIAAVAREQKTAWDEYRAESAKQRAEATFARRVKEFQDLVASDRESRKKPETDAEYLARVTGTRLGPRPQMQLFSPDELKKQLADSVTITEDVLAGMDLTKGVEKMRFDMMKDMLGEGVAGALEEGFASGLEAALTSGRISDLWKSLSQTMVSQIAKMMVNVALTFIKFGSMIERIQKFLVANPGVAIAAAVAMLTLATSLGGGGGKQGERVFAGGASGLQSTVVPRMTTMTFGSTTANMASSSVNAMAPMNITVIGPNDPTAQRAIQELMTKANRRGSV